MDTAQPGSTKMVEEQGHTLFEAQQGAELRHLHAGQSTLLISGSLKVSVHEDANEQWLVINVAGLEIPFAKTTRVVYTKNSFIWPATQEVPDLDRSEGDGYLELALLPHVIDTHQKDLFEQILQSYAAAAPLPPSGAATPTTAQDSTFSDEFRNQVLLIDDQGQVVGDLALPIQEDSDLKTPGRSPDEPVLLSLDADALNPAATISPLSQVSANYGRSSSRIVQGAEGISTRLLGAAENVAQRMSSAASNYASKNPVPAEPVVFYPIARKGVNGLAEVSNHAATISSKTFGMIGNFAETSKGSLGARVGTAFSKPPEPGQAPKPSTGFRSSLKNSLIALNTIIDSVEASGKHVWSQSTEASSKVALHRFGPDAGEAVSKIGNTGQNFAMVYVDARGVGRTALLKNLGKGAIRARLANGQEVVLKDTAARAPSPAAQSAPVKS